MEHRTRVQIYKINSPLFENKGTIFETTAGRELICNKQEN
jgi:hypothetical protein